MNIEELLHGESKNIEYKEKLPSNSDRYTRTVVAFANSQGGKIVFGIADGTNRIVGIDDEILFQVMDSIAAAIYHSCEPAIVPDIEPCTADGKNLIVVTVSPGTQRPYYLKSKGKEAGTYVRVGGTTRPAHPETIKDLELEGANISWDALPCIGFKVTREAIEKLCKDMNRYRKELQNRKDLPEVTEINLENWKLITKNSDGCTASNAFALLTSEHFQLAKTQCAVFKGTDRVVFLDKREYTGPLYEQIEEAVMFVLRNIRLGAEIRGIRRVESYELPVDAIREMIVNAHCHRNYNEPSSVQVAVYDDRLEVTSPGGLYKGLTLEQALEGHSTLRNRIIANVFCQMGLIESWGTGLRRIKSLAADFNLPPPEFIDSSIAFRVNLFRKTALNDEHQTGSKTSEKPRNSIGETSEEFRNNFGKTSEKLRNNFGRTSETVQVLPPEENDNKQNNQLEQLNSTQKKIVGLLKENSTLTAESLARQIGISSRSVEYNIQKIKEQGLIVRHGSHKDGYWEVKV